MSQNILPNLLLALLLSWATTVGFAQKSFLARKSPIQKSKRFVFNVASLNTYKGGWILKNQNKEVINPNDKVFRTVHPKVYVVGNGVKITRMAIVQGNPKSRGTCEYRRYYRVKGHKFFFKDYYLRKDMMVKIWIEEAVDVRTWKKMKVKNKEIKFWIR